MKTEVLEIIEIDSNLESKIRYEVNAGNIIGVSTDTVFGLAFDAGNEKALHNIAEIKKRDNELFTYHIADISQLLDSELKFNENVIDYIEAYMPGAVTFIIPDADDDNTYGIRMPANVLSRQFFSLFPFPSVVATSCNLSGKQSLTERDDIVDFLDGRVPLILFEKGIAAENIPSTIIQIDNDLNKKCIREGVLTISEFL
ncbi:MAG: L-threonylcarbamoyladenylate synthase [Candidatus Muiribacteriaceae bacterium]